MATKYFEENFVQNNLFRLRGYTRIRWLKALSYRQKHSEFAARLSLYVVCLCNERERMTLYVFVYLAKWKETKRTKTTTAKKNWMKYTCSYWSGTKQVCVCIGYNHIVMFANFLHLHVLITCCCRYIETKSVAAWIPSLLNEVEMCTMKTNQFVFAHEVAKNLYQYLFIF